MILLDVPQDVSERLMAVRTGKTGGETGDIHEKDRDFLRKCHAAYGELADKYGWQKVACAVDGELRSAESIHEDIYRLVADSIK